MIQPVNSKLDKLMEGLNTACKAAESALEATEMIQVDVSLLKQSETQMQTKINLLENGWQQFRIKLRAAQESVAVIQGLRSQLSTARAEISALQQGHQRELADVHSSLAAAHAEIASLQDAHEEENEVLSNRHEEEVTLLKTEKMDLMLAKSGLSTSAHDARVAAALATERAEQAESDLARVSTELTTAKKSARFLADQAKDRYVRANHEACHKEIAMLKAKLGSREAVIHAIHPGGLTDPDLPKSEDVPAGRPPSLPPRLSERGAYATYLA
ncbi:UNVERIFIED_CONTAM: hypothetical protein K2H54_055256 [Gekko kuhli]